MKVDGARAQHLLNCLEKTGADRNKIAKILHQFGLRKADLWPTPKKISYLDEALLVRAACDVVGDTTFGMRAALTFDGGTLLTAYIAKYSQNLKAAIESTSRFYDLFDPALIYRLRVSGNVGSFEIDWKDATYAKYHRHVEFMMFFVLSRMRALTQVKFYPIEIRFSHNVGASALTYSKVCGFPVVFGAERPEILLSHSTLNLLIPTYDPSLRNHLIAYGERLLSEGRQSKQTLRAKVEGRITEALPGKVPTSDGIASTLGMSNRTFTRRLSEEGITYRAIVEVLRYDLAKTFLKDDMSLAEIAFTLGYSDQAAFSTAFKRWSGKAPSQFRFADR